MTEAERRARARIRRNQERHRRMVRQNMILAAGLLAMALLVIWVFVTLIRGGARKTAAQDSRVSGADAVCRVEAPEIDEQLIPVNPYSRPGTALEQVNGIVVHYTANPGTSARQNRDYFAGLAETHTTSASSHFIIGLEGEIICCVPCEEIAYASNERNADTISIECCIEDDSGRFNKKTYDTLVQLTAWLLCRYGLDTDAILRHYDVTGKNCPKYYVENESSWRMFKSEVREYIDERGEAGT